MTHEARGPWGRPGFRRPIGRRAGWSLSGREAGAHPLAWFVGSLAILWYCLEGREGSHVVRERPWYKQKVTPTFTDLLGALRLQMWEYEVFGATGEDG
jgi:hypothetical protein